MNRLKKWIGFGLMVLPMALARGEFHSPGGTVGRLIHESQELTQVVRYVGLPYQVQQSVDRFNFDVYRLADCVRFTCGGNMQFMGVPQQCGQQLHMARRTFRMVEGHLGGGALQIPQVYHSFMRTRDALFSLQVVGFPGGPGPYPGPGPNPNPYPGPGPQPGPYPGPGWQQVSCIAVDAGWEEHSGGHLAYGRNIRDAQRAALMSCQQFHGRCRIQQCR